MTVSSTSNKIQYTGNGSTDTFSFPYIFFADTDLLVTLTTIATGVDVSPAPVLNGSATYDYTVSGVFDSETGEYTAGADVVFNNPPDSTVRITIERVVPQTQGVVLIDNSKFPANTVNGALDRLTVLVQRQSQLIEQSVQAPSTDPTGISLLLPASAIRANKVAAFDSTGNLTASDLPAGGGVGDVVAASNNVMTGDNQFTGDNSFEGNDEHSGTDLFTGDVTMTGAVDLDGASSVLVPDLSGHNVNDNKAANSEYIATLLAVIAGKAIWGNLWQNNAGDATNDIDIAAGGCMDSAGTYLMLGGALTKRLDAAWAVGTNQGGLDTGSIGNNDYYIHRIARPDTGVVDALFSLSPTSPTLPANYTKSRLIGWFKRVGGTIVAFHTYASDGGAIDFAWDAPTLDINLAATLTTSRRTDAVKVPLNFSTVAHLNVTVVDGSAVFGAWICCPDQTDAAPSFSAAPLGNIASENTLGNGAMGELRIRTSAAGLIAARADLATVDLYAVSTLGFHWARQ